MTCLQAGDSQSKDWIIPHKTTIFKDIGVKDLSPEDRSASD